MSAAEDALSMMPITAVMAADPGGGDRQAQREDVSTDIVLASGSGPSRETGRTTMPSATRKPGTESGRREGSGAQGSDAVLVSECRSARLRPVPQHPGPNIATTVDARMTSAERRGSARRRGDKPITIAQIILVS
jgi:hypothetical protein